MTSAKIRQIFLDFFEKHGHTIVPSSSLLPTDPTVLFTTAGMQQFKEYYLEKPSPYGKKVASCQKCFRTSDIEEVGNEKHLTFLEMLGNFSFGDPEKPDGIGAGYFKKEAIELAYELLISNFQFPNSKLWITYFKPRSESASLLRGKGDPSKSSGQVVPEDKESREIWQRLGIPRERIFGFGKEDNFWGPTGIEGPCGPTTEIHYDLTQKSCPKGRECIPNCQCGRFIELWNLVFNEYYQDRDSKLTLLEQKGVDTGMGLERLVMVLQQKESVFETDLFEPLIREIRNLSHRAIEPYNHKAVRIIADHIKGSVFLASEGILPSNVEEGYVLRRILRRAIRFGKLLAQPSRALRAGFLIPLAQKVIEIYQKVYPEVKSRETDILTIIQNEEEKFEKTLERGLKEFEKISQLSISSQQLTIKGIDAFHLFDTYGFPLELTTELAKEKGLEVDKKDFEIAFEKHREISRAGAEKKFGGIGKEATYTAAKLHTATHLLHAALRKILGSHIKQMGSDITPKRLRFDFTHPQKMTTQELKRVEDSVNQKIRENLKVKKEEMPYNEAIKSGALAFFKEKYPEIVSVYSIGAPSDPSDKYFSKEICGGPHVQKTSELGHFKIIKEESSGAGVRRIRAILE